MDNNLMIIKTFDHYGGPIQIEALISDWQYECMTLNGSDGDVLATLYVDIDQKDFHYFKSIPISTWGEPGVIELLDISFPFNVSKILSIETQWANHSKSIRMIIEAVMTFQQNYQVENVIKNYGKIECKKDFFKKEGRSVHRPTLKVFRSLDRTDFLDAD